MTSDPAPYRRVNQIAWNRLAEGSLFSHVATDEECRNPLGTLDSRGWLPASVAGLDVLCLAAAGGWQSILYAVAGARVTVVDISPGMLERARERARAYAGRLDLVRADARALAFADRSFDSVVAVCTFCSVPDPVRGLCELRRVLKPEGRLLLFEHVRSRLTPLAIMQDLMTPFTRRLGPDMNRDTVAKSNFCRSVLSVPTYTQSVPSTGFCQSAMANPSASFFNPDPSKLTTKISDGPGSMRVEKTMRSPREVRRGIVRLRRSARMTRSPLLSSVSSPISTS